MAMQQRRRIMQTRVKQLFRSIFNQRSRLPRAQEMRVEMLEPRLLMDSTVVFNEIHYHDPVDDISREWVELYNQQGVNVDLSGWRISGGIDYTFEEGTVIEGGGHLVIAVDPSEMNNAFGYPDALGPYTSRLSNSGETLRLRDRNDRIMDEVDYNDGGDWTVAADGTGATLARNGLYTSTDDPGNWRPSLQIGGTPGQANFPQGDGPLLGDTTTLIDFGSAWRFDDSGTGYTDTSWTQLNFDPDNPDADAQTDDAWGSGAGPLGVEEGSIPTPITTSTNHVNTVYFRNTFEFTGTPSATLLELSHYIDDGAVFYLNGTEIARYNMPAGSIDFDTKANAKIGNADVIEGISISSDQLVVGTNVLAVEVHQNEEVAMGGGAAEPIGSGSGQTISPSFGYDITWNGNDGLHFEPGAPASVPDNLALTANGATPFTSSDLGPQIGVGFHNATNINDGLYGNSNSWIGAIGDANPYAGVDLGQLTEVRRIAWGRDNGVGGLGTADQFTDRWQGVYEVQFTSDATVDGNSNWTTIGTLNYQSNDDNVLDGGFTGYLRHEYNVSTSDDGPIMATGIRILVPLSGIAGGTAIDEIEIYDTATDDPPDPPDLPELTLVEVGGNISQDNLALSSTGAVAFAKDVLPGYPAHTIPHLNDGIFGNSNSWIGNSSPTFAGVALGGPQTIESIAWGRSNTADFSDRAAGTYTVQYTTVPNPDASTPDNSWMSFESITYAGTAQDALRHLYTFDPIENVTGVRIIVSAGGLGGGIAIDEIEVIGPAIPDLVFDAKLTATQVLPDPAKLSFNEATRFDNPNFFLELKNDDTQSLALDGMILRSSDPLRPDYVFPVSSIAADGFVVITATELGYTPDDEEVLSLISPDQTVLIDAVRIDNELRGRAQSLDNQWLFPSAETPGAQNTFDFNDAIVINEIQYHAYPTLATPGTPPSFDITNIISIDDTWRYNATGADLGFGWDDLAHSVDGVNWLSGPGLIGFETSPGSLPFAIGTQLDDPLTGDFVTTYYFEHDFEFNGNLNNVQMNLRHVIDDGAIFYLNGTEIARHNMPDGLVSASDFASVGVSDASLVDFGLIDTSALVNGTNRLSVEVHQTTNTSSDVMFGVQLSTQVQTGPGTPGTEFIEDDEEWIELYNRSAQPVDLSGWQFDDGINFEFEPGTILQPDSYLIITRDLDLFNQKYPEVSSDLIAGEYGGTLANSGENILLVDANKNPVDEVHYLDGGRWHDLADGDGSTLELIDPHADNTKPEAWRASDESDQGVWETITYRGVVQPDGFGERYHEFILGLLDSGVVLIDDISVIRDPDGAAVQMIQNGTFESDTLGAEADTWRIQGTHSGTVITDPENAGNKVLRMAATGVWEDRINHAETTFANGATIVNGAEYEISFKARWVEGSSQLNSHFYFGRMMRTHVLSTPDRAGTPGQANDGAVVNAGPTYDNLTHGPVNPQPGESVTIGVNLQDNNGIDTVTLHWRIDGLGWATVTMNQVSGAVGTLGARYEASIPGAPAGTIVQFYVEASDTLGATSTFPAEGEDSRALYVVQDGQLEDDLAHDFRLIMLNADHASQHVPTQTTSNQRLGATVIYEGEVYYNVQVRLKGTNAGRSSFAYNGYNIKFDPTQEFRGVHGSIAIDRSGRGGTAPASQDEILIKHIANHAGDIYFMYDDLVNFIGPVPALSRTAMLGMARYGNVFLDSQFEDGGDGTLFKLDIAYVPNGTTDGNPESLKIMFPYNHPAAKDLQDLGPDKEAYRNHLLIRNNRAEDDFSRIIELSQAFSLPTNALEDVIDELIDVDQWLRTFALQSLTGVADTYTRGGLHHNINFYVNPEDDRVVLLPWDWDFAFTLPTNTSLFGGFSNATKLLNMTGNLRLFQGHLLDIINTTFNNDYMDEWIAHYGDVANQNYSGISGYISARRSFVLSQLLPNVPFEITNNAGNDFSTDTSSVTLTGNGWIDVREIRLAGSDEPLDIEWTDNDSWEVTLPLLNGENVFALEAYNPQGELVGSDTITITSTATTPVFDHLRISEINYHPAEVTQAEIDLGFTDKDQFEFIELINTSDTETLDLTGVRFTDGISFDFTNSNVTALEPGAMVLLVSDLAAFTARYGTEAADGTVYHIAGQYDSQLSNGGEILVLEDSVGLIVESFEYHDGDDLGEEDWHPLTDGAGPSLDANNLHADKSNGTNWRSSGLNAGTPGRLAAEVGALSGDANYDGLVNLEDLAKLATNFGSNANTDPMLDIRWLHGDFTGDGIVDLADLAKLATNFGQSQLFGGQAAAESSLLIQNIQSDPNQSESQNSQSEAFFINTGARLNADTSTQQWNHIGSLLEDDDSVSIL